MVISDAYLLDRVEEAIIRRVGGGEFLPVTRRPGQMRQAFLLGLGALGVVSRIAIGDQGAGEVHPEQFARYLPRAGELSASEPRPPSNRNGRAGALRVPVLKLN